MSNDGILRKQRKAAEAHAKANPAKPTGPITGGAGPVKKP